MSKCMKSANFLATRAVYKNFLIFNEPNNLNNIEIINDTIRLKINGKVIKEKKLVIDERILYKKSIPKNCFTNYTYSVFEADRKANYNVWKKIYKRIDFPKFITTLLLSLVEIGDIPDFIDFCQIYMLTFTEKASLDELDSTLYAKNPPNYEKHIGNFFDINGFKLENKLIKFKEEFVPYVHNLPQNLFTTEQICCRLYKVYFSVVRDICNTVNLAKYGVPTYYSLLDDLEGIDMIVYDRIPVAAYTKTFAGQNFRVEKVLERHPNLNHNISIVLKKKIEPNNFDIAGKTVADTINDFVSNMKNGELIIEY